MSDELEQFAARGMAAQRVVDALTYPTTAAVPAGTVMRTVIKSTPETKNGLFGPGIFGTGIDLSALDEDTALSLGAFFGEQILAAEKRGQERAIVERCVVYVAMVADRHADPEPYVFSTAEAAIECAQIAARENARDTADIEEEAIEGWLYHANYSVEGDSVWVIVKTIDEFPDSSEEAQ